MLGTPEKRISDGRNPVARSSNSQTGGDVGDLVGGAHQIEHPRRIARKRLGMGRRLQRFEHVQRLPSG
jgi:hypothetical protein